MSNSTAGIIDTISASQLTKEVTANAYFDAVSPANFLGRRASLCNGRTWCFYGGTMLIDGVLTQIYLSSSNTTVIDASTTTYFELTRAGVINKASGAFTAGNIPLYVIVTDASTVTSYTDYRAWANLEGATQRSSIVMATDANKTLTQAQAVATILSVTSSVSLAATRNIVVPLAVQQWTVFNNTTGAQSLQFIGASGTGITVANGKRAILYADGTNVVRVTADV